ncbi:Predicted membrane protein [Sphingomonas paucimobilis]|nr:Predicted membrane protein [Sphingomonas paucimobilis]
MIRRLRRNRRGSVGILIALSGVMIVGGAAFGIDIGMLTLSQRKLQGTADEAALAAMASSPERRSQAIGQVLTANGVADASSDMILGRYDANPDILPEARFIPGTDGGAMRVVLRRPVPLIFGRILTGKATQQVSASAVAQRMDYVAFSVGSRAARAGGGLPGAFLNALAGTNLSLSLFDYQALASAEVELLQMIPLLGTRIGLTGASFDTILAADIRLPVLLNAMADTTTHPGAAAALRVIASHALNSKVPLNRLIDLGPLGKMSKAQSREVVNVGVYQMLREVLAISNGQRQFYMDLGGTLPGLTSTKIMLVIGDRPAKTPWLAVTQNGSATVQTSQMRMLVDVQIGVPRMANIELPIYMEAASARARRSSMSCWESTPSVTIESIPPPAASLSRRSTEAAWRTCGNRRSWVRPRCCRFGPPRSPAGRKSTFRPMRPGNGSPSARRKSGTAQPRPSPPIRQHKAMPVHCFTEWTSRSKRVVAALDSADCLRSWAPR